MNLAYYSDDNPVTGRSVLWWVISFFVAIFIANGFFIFYALSSWTGLSTENAYTKGVRYNETLAQSSAQQVLGWKSNITLGQVDTKGRGVLQIGLVDAKGAPLKGLNVSALIFRPVKEGDDHTLKLREKDGGTYEAIVTFPHLGRWQIEVVVGNKYRLRHDIEVK